MVNRQKEETRKRNQEKAREEFKRKLKPILKFILSIKQMINIDINIKLIPNPKPTKHDYAILARAPEIFEGIEDLEDMQPLISMFLNKVKQWFTVKLANVKYDKQRYICIYLDVPETTKTKMKEALQ